uniref:Secreted protein n=1 Tax=Pyxicephalus adspersus TaxID=30357 RepID=A0AAV3A0C2_PYXAD|nr:TPA: hypothetical protein GDO54_017721 [Pyxicephalus adspersus]
MLYIAILTTLLPFSVLFTQPLVLSGKVNLSCQLSVYLSGASIVCGQPFQSRHPAMSPFKLTIATKRMIQLVEFITSRRFHTQNVKEKIGMLCIHSTKAVFQIMFSLYIYL